MGRVDAINRKEREDGGEAVDVVDAVVEHVNHLGTVAEVCREIGVAEWLDAHEPRARQRVSVGTATVVMVLNGLGFSNRQLYLVPQFFADKPIEHLLGLGITADDLNDDCLGRTLDWLYAHDVTRLFAGLAMRARQAFEIPLTAQTRLHGDTTSFSVSGAYLPRAGDVDAQTIAVTYGYSRDHREDLKQWMLGLVTCEEGVPLFLQPLDGNASDKATLSQVVLELMRQLRLSTRPPGIRPGTLLDIVSGSGVLALMSQSVVDGDLARPVGGTTTWRIVYYNTLR